MRSSRCTTVFTWTWSSVLVRVRLAPWAKYASRVVTRSVERAAS